MCQHKLTYFFVYKLGVFHRRLIGISDKTTPSAKSMDRLCKESAWVTATKSFI